MLHNASEKHSELKITTWTVSLFSSSVHEFAGTYPIDFGRVVRLFDCKTNRSRFLRYAGKKNNEKALITHFIDRTMHNNKNSNKNKQKTKKMETNLPISLGSSSSLFSSRSSTLSFFSSPSPRGSLYHWSENKITVTDKYCIQSANDMTSTNDTVYSFQILINKLCVTKLSTFSPTDLITAILF